MTRVRLLGSEFDPLTQAGAVDAVVEMIRAGERGCLSTVNVAILMMMRDDERLRRFVDGARFVVADGQPLIWASRMVGTPLPERVAGVDLVYDLSARAEKERLGVYVLGGKPEVCTEMVARIAARFPRLAIRGYADGYFRPGDEEAALVRAIAESGADILFVALGAPRQEEFLSANWDRLGVRFAVGVGGSFDVLTGRLRRAPAFLQGIGLEWAFRLSQEPRRLWKRYLVTNSRFLWLFARRLIFGEPRRGGGETRTTVTAPKGADPIPIATERATMDATPAALPSGEPLDTPPASHASR